MRGCAALAWRELRAQRVTSVLILLAVILSTTMTAAIGQSLGTLNACACSRRPRSTGTGMSPCTT